MVPVGLGGDELLSNIQQLSRPPMTITGALRHARYRRSLAGEAGVPV